MNFTNLIFQLSDVLTKKIIELVQYKPMMKCGFTFEEYFKQYDPKNELSMFDKIWIYSDYRQKLDELHNKG